MKNTKNRRVALDDFLLLCYNNKVKTAVKCGFCVKTIIKNKAKKEEKEA